MKNKSVLFLGALSDIAKSTIQKFGENGYDLQLAARNIDDLKKLSTDLKIRYNTDINVYEFDILKTENHQNFIKNLKEIPSIVICAVGLLGEQKENENDTELRVKVLRTNYEGPVNIISDFANIFENRGFGTIVGISSVAGDRGRASNYIYGSAKSGFTTFLSGLRNKFSSKGVHVITVLPGYVFTKMTKNMNLPKLLTAQPKEVAKDVIRALNNKKNVIFTPKIWKLIILILKLIPENLFKRTKL